MNKKSVEENFNVLYKKLNQESYQILSKLKEDAKKETVIRWLAYSFCAIFIIFCFYLLSVVFKNFNISLPFELIMIFTLAALIIALPIFIGFYFTKKGKNYDNEWKKIVYDAIFENINENWEYYTRNEFKSYLIKQGSTDYFEAKFPKNGGGLSSNSGIKNKINGNILDSMFFTTYSTDGDGYIFDHYKGIYFSISNNNSILNDIYIRSKKWDGLLEGKLPFSKLDINNNNYNVYSESLNAIPSGLIELIDNFYESTNIHCDLSISKNKLQIRFDVAIKQPEKEILDKDLLYKMYCDMFQINEFIENLCDLLSNK